MRMSHRVFVLALVLRVLATPASAQPAPIVPAEWLVLSPVPGAGRSAFTPSPAWRKYVLPVECPVPQAGERTDIWPGRTATWTAMVAKDGVLEGQALGSAFCYTEVESSEPRVVLLEATGFMHARLGDQLLAGDFYGNGTLRQPVALAAGKSSLLVATARGRLELRLVPPRGPVELGTSDATLPDLREGRVLDALGAIPVLNATAAPVVGAVLEVGDDVVFRKATVRLGTLAPLATQKVPFPLVSVPGAAIPADAKTVPLVVVVRPPEGAAVQVTLDVEVARGDAAFRETFVSALDGSVQYYAIKPTLATAPADPPPALVLSLHGAAVEAIRQARAYSAHRWAFVVCPTNRRPFGFDWEDWGREDALEVLAVAGARHRHDPARVYLTGHSMGGHGTWHVGALCPDRWAAIGPSAGWISFGTYGGGGEDTSPWGTLARRLGGASDTLALAQNLEPLGIYVLHGDADDNVPVAQARAMRQALGAFHKDLSYHEQPGAGHWWDSPAHPGADCVDWPPMWRLFQRRRNDLAPTRVAFVTPHPAASDRCHWVRVLNQRDPYALTRIVALVDPRGRFEVTTTNVARFRIDPTSVVDAPGALGLTIDGVALTCNWTAGELEAVHDGATWTVGPPSAPGLRKRPSRQGPFRQAFGNRFLLVYGTGGEPRDRAAALARARLDAARWWYQGNGRAEIISDAELDPAVHGGRNWVFYGNEATHAGWKALAARWPLSVAPGRIALGTHVAEGPGLACLACLPHPDDPATLVGLVGGSDAEGLRLSAAVPVLFSGVALADAQVWDAEVLARGATALRWAAVLDDDWGLGPKAIVVRGER